MSSVYVSFFISVKSDGRNFSIFASAILVTVLHARFRIPWDREINLCQEGVTVVFASDLRSRNINHVSHSVCFVFFNARQIRRLALHSHFQFMGSKTGMRTFSHFTRPARRDGGILHYKTGTVWFIFFTDSRGNVRVTSEVGNSRRRKIASSWENLIPFFHCSIPFCPIITTILDLTRNTSFPRKGASHDLCVAPVFFINRLHFKSWMSLFYFHPVLTNFPQNPQFNQALITPQFFKVGSQSYLGREVL